MVLLSYDFIKFFSNPVAYCRLVVHLISGRQLDRTGINTLKLY
ncbi:hypothetical protein BH10CHL1_BH10CHL1_07960 [soil metagenome]